ncbi:MAG: hypothetical protein JJ899_04840 [Alphaproteobacteria bacterium]|nr:hypothetical protein [Alphaproteobacteria bacterium]
MARPGRKRSVDARRRRRTRAGRRTADAGTPELIAKRALLVGADGARDPRAADPLGILQMAGHISRDQMDAGWIYAVMRWRAFGKPTPYTSVYERYATGLTGFRAGEASLYPDTDLRARDIFARGDNALRNAGRLAWSETRRATVEHTVPAWYWRLKSGPPGRADALERAALLRGLDALAEVYGRGASGTVNSRASRLG